MVYDDGVEIDESVDPGKEVGELVQGVATLAQRRNDEKTLRKTKAKLPGAQRVGGGVQRGWNTCRPFRSWWMGPRPALYGS